MSDEIKKREELKAKINEKLDALSLEDLEKVAGGENLPLEHFGLKYCAFCSTLYPIGSVHRCSDYIKRCPYCGEVFNTGTLYDIHLDEVHGVKQ